MATIAFTGSRAVGLSIIRDAAVVQTGQRHVKRVIAEMGGKNAILIDDDADLDEAVVGVLASATGYAGQKCSACSRVIVIGSAYEPFVAKLKEAIASLRIGPADDPATTVGPVVDADARERILKFVELGKQSAKSHVMLDVPSALADRGYFVPVALFEMDDPRHPLCQDEIFGPVLAVLRASDLTDALKIADDSPYALTGGFYSRSPENIARVRKEFRVGNLYVNRKITGALVDRQPFGGSRLSGVGAKAGGPDYLLQFLTPRTVTESVMRRGLRRASNPLNAATIQTSDPSATCARFSSVARATRPCRNSLVRHNGARTLQNHRGAPIAVPNHRSFAAFEPCTRSTPLDTGGSPVPRMSGRPQTCRL